MEIAVRVLKAHIRAGQVVVDEPTELAEGEEVQVVLGPDEMDDVQRAALDAALDESEAEARTRGTLEPGAVLGRVPGEPRVTVRLTPRARREAEPVDEPAGDNDPGST